LNFAHKSVCHLPATHGHWKKLPSSMIRDSLCTCRM
jgi:hypothetical protein